MLGGFWRFLRIEGDDNVSNGTPNIRRLLPAYTDFSDNSSTKFPPFSMSALATGTCTQETAEPDHPGVVGLKSSTSANSGELLYLGGNFIVFTGGEIAELIFKLPAAALGTRKVQFGFGDGGSPANPVVDGAWFDITGSVLTGKTANNSSISTSGTSYTLSGDTWYHLRVAVNDAATRVDFYLYDGDGVVLWTDYLTTNIPTDAARLTQPTMSVINTAAAAAAYLMYLDAMAFYGTKDIR